MTNDHDWPTSRAAHEQMVAYYLAALKDIASDDIERLDEVLREIPPTVREAVGRRGGPLLREKLLAPVMARAVRDGIIEWTGKYAQNGQKIYRATESLAA